MSLMIRRRGLPALGLAAAVPARAQTSWLPDRPVRLIVPFPAGGPNDIIARALADRLASLLRQPVVVENRSGAGGVVGTDAVAKSAPDGLTLAVTSAGALAIAPSLLPTMPYDTARDLALITLVATVPELLAVHPSVPARTLAELVAHARANPGKLNFASTGNGSMPHLAGEMFRFAAGIDIVHIPYRGAAPAVTDLLGGQVQMLWADLPVLLPHLRSGGIRGLAQGGRARSSALPEIDTTAEAGFAAVQAENWYGLVAAGRTPAPILAALHAAAAAALAEPGLRRVLSDQGAEPGGGTPAAFAEFVRAETARWAEVVRRSGATAD